MSSSGSMFSLAIDITGGSGSVMVSACVYVEQENTSAKSIKQQIIIVLFRIVFIGSVLSMIYDLVEYF